MRRGNSLIRLLLVVAVIVIAIAFPRSAGKHDVFSRETGAIAAIRTIHTAETEYYWQSGRYAGSLRALAPLIADGLASGVEGAYRFTLTATWDTYQVHVSPISGGKFFYSDQTMILLRVNDGPSLATASSPESK